MSYDLKFLNALNSIPSVGPQTLRALKTHFGTFETAWFAEEKSLRESAIQKTALDAILWKRPSLHPDREMENLIREKIWVMSEDDNNFPPILKEIPHAPLLLYGRGNPAALAPASIAVVGTRRPTHYGLEATEILVHKLAEAGAVITSGLAIGIDTRAHESALDVKGKTIGVLGSGVDQETIFPKENRGLARRIADSGGAIISEYAPKTPALKEHFPQRNRIISGLSRGVLVIEARERSGALITARFALEHNRDVFAVPGPIFSFTSKGPNLLIQEGAKLVSSAEDILNELGIAYNIERGESEDSPLDTRSRLLLQILETPLGIDELKEKTNLDTGIIVASLSILELQGRIKNMGGDTYQKI